MGGVGADADANQHQPERKHDCGRLRGMTRTMTARAPSRTTSTVQMWMTTHANVDSERNSANADNEGKVSFGNPFEGF